MGNWWSGTNTVSPAPEEPIKPADITVSADKPDDLKPNDFKNDNTLNDLKNNNTKTDCICESPTVISPIVSPTSSNSLDSVVSVNNLTDSIADLRDLKSLKDVKSLTNSKDTILIKKRSEPIDIIPKISPTNKTHKLDKPIIFLEDSPSHSRAGEYVNKKINEWFDFACCQFGRYPSDQILENDSPFDIDSLEQEFYKFYKRLTGKHASYVMFSTEVSKRCRKTPKHSGRPSRFNHSVEHDFDD
jgi:hypothetical protein